MKQTNVMFINVMFMIEKQIMEMEKKKKKE